MKVKSVLDHELKLMGYKFLCLGCNEHHVIYTEPSTGKVIWGFNGDMEKPTFTPSLRVMCGHYCTGQEGKKCWCDYHKEHPEDTRAPICYMCHSIITDGKIQYQNDCTHKLAGQTVEMEDII
jgi:hypothetical protein